MGQEPQGMAFHGWKADGTESDYATMEAAFADNCYSVSQMRDVGPSLQSDHGPDHDYDGLISERNALRASNAKLTTAVTKLAARATTAEAENKRLREALERASGGIDEIWNRILHDRPFDAQEMCNATRDGIQRALKGDA